MGTLLALGLLAAPAQADSGFGFGVGTGLGVHASDSPDNAGDSGVVADLNLRAKFLWILGLDLRFNLQDAAAYKTGDTPQFAARYRTTLLVHVLPIGDVSVYLGGGIGATDFSDLLNPSAAGASYHAGLGLEWQLSERFALDAGFYLLIPGWKSVERDVERRANLELARFQANPAGGTPEVPEDLPIGDYVSASNFELMVRAMMTF